MADREFDYLVYGASGFTGKEVAKTLARDIAADDGHAGAGLPGRSWAVGGRSRSKLDAISKECEESLQASTPFLAPGIVVADVEHDAHSDLVSTFGRARVVLNCVGPFVRLGPKVVSACIDAGTHYVDVSGEPNFIFSCMADYNEKAMQKGVLVVSACGFDSVPSELGCIFAAKTVADAVRSGGASEAIDDSSQITTHIESFMHVDTGTARNTAHSTTFECAIMGFANAADTKKLYGRVIQQTRRLAKTDPPSAQKIKPPKFRAGLFRDDRAKLAARYRKAPYCIPFPGADAAVVKQTQRLDAAGLTKTPDHMRTDSCSIYFVVGDIWATAALICAAVLISIISKFPAGRRFLISNPEIASFGVFSKAGPTLEARLQTNITIDSFCTRYVGSTPRGHAVTRVEVNDPGYGATAKLLIAAASTIIEDRDAAASGGVLTPAAALSNTAFLDRVQSCGALKLSVVRTDSL